MNTFHNTIHAKGIELQKLIVNAKRQEDKILRFFYENAGKGFTPFDVQKRMNLNAPITSVRRAITNLTRDEYLVKMEVKKSGPYGVANHYWKLDPELETQLTLF